MADHLISTTAAAARLGVTDQTVRNWIKGGRMPASVRVGRTYLVDIRDVEALEGSATPDDLTRHIAKVVAAAPPLSDDQITRITTILHASRGTAPALSRTA